MLVNKLGRLQMPQMNRIKSAAHNAKLFALHSFTHLPYYHYIIPKTGKLAQLYVNIKITKNILYLYYNKKVPYLL